FSMFQNAYLNQSLNLAALVQEQFREHVGRHDRGVKQAGFWVLYKVAMPSILIEAGFISNPEEEKFLNSEDGVTYLASAIYRAFKAYKKDFEADNLLKEESLEVYLEEPDNQNIAHDTTNQYSNIPSFPPAENDEICFRIQIGTSKDSIDTLQNMYPAFNDLWQYKHNGYYKHTTEKTNDYQKIVSLHEKVSAKIEDCFIVAFRNNKRMTVRDAIKTLNQ
ncbi:MAG: N-acetylmuramoyl-L-alanine amidase family protein, partial [Bacteroidales bacterium]